MVKKFAVANIMVSLLAFLFIAYAYGAQPTIQTLRVGTLTGLHHGMDEGERRIPVLVLRMVLKG